MKENSLKELESEFLQSVSARFEPSAAKERIEYLFTWYSRKARFHKRWYNWTRFFTYLIPCLITLVSVYASVCKKSDCALIAIATLSTILVGVHHIIDHFRFYENWIRYRSTVEKLKREAENFLSGYAPYTRPEDKADELKKINRIFARNVEKIAMNELDNWENLQDESYKSLKEALDAALRYNSGSGSNGKDKSGDGKDKPAGEENNAKAGEAAPKSSSDDCEQRPDRSPTPEDPDERK